MRIAGDGLKLEQKRKKKEYAERKKKPQEMKQAEKEGRTTTIIAL